ncbi:MAG TPA: polysaccharide biosynthesis tyrosine autokinase [Gemmatimonadaceae bacterium]|nr:polysaccharide biosynthesis tyrosine autokinase [Gemmatimonadaceae bacterium]
MPAVLPANPPDPSSPRGVIRTTPLAMPAPRFRDDEFEESGVDWRRIGSALNRYKWMIVAVTLAVTGAAAAATRFIHPTYSAQSTVWIDEGQHGNNASASGPIRPAQTFEPEAWLDLLRTYAVLDSVVHDLQLNVSFSSPADSLLVRGFGLKPDFRAGDYRLGISDDGRLYTLTERTHGQLDQGAVGDSIGRSLGFQWAPGPGALGARHDVSFSVGTLRDAARSLGESLQAHIDPEGNFLKIELDGTDPSRLTATLNDVTHRYVALAADLRTRKLTQLTGILADQRDYAHKSLTAAEQSLAAFQERTATLPHNVETSAPPASPQSAAAATEDPVTAGYFDAQRQLTQVRHERTELQRFAAGKGNADLMVSELEQFPSVQKSSELTGALKDLGAKQAELRALLYRYSDAYPAVQHLQGVIADIETNTIPPMINGLVADLERKEADLAGTTSKSAADLRAIPQRATDETRLKRNVTLAENLYNGLQARYDEAHVAEASSTPDVRVLDEAVMPQRPVKNTAPRIILLALLASFSLASIGAVLADKTDARFRYPDQVSGEMGLTILGVLPHARGRHRDTNGLENAKLLEAFRAIRLNVTCAYGAAGPVVLTVTSPGSSEGKSFLTSHLGRVFADGGRRVLVVDGDLRRGTLHRRLGVVRKPGLADYLRGSASIDEIVQHTVHTRVDVITCGTRTHDAPELLGAQAMAQLLTAMRSRYDVILCDSPPLSAGVDPFVLGSATGNLLLVLRTGVSHRELTEAKLDVVSRLPIRLLGTVLNDVPDDPVFGYYSYYLPGYEAEDERGAGKEPTVLV